MNKFLFKSSDPDLQKMLSILETLQKNVLYLTYRLDAVLKKVNTLGVDTGLVKQTLDYYDEDIPPHPEDKDDLDWALVIKTATKTKRPSNPRARPSPIGAAYELGKQTLQYYGYYERLKKYDPVYYIDRYSYKPQKRAIGYAQLSKGFLKKTRGNVTKRRKFYQECTPFSIRFNRCEHGNNSSKSGQFSTFYGFLWCLQRMCH